MHPIRHKVLRRILCIERPNGMAGGRRLVHWMASDRKSMTMSSNLLTHGLISCRPLLLSQSTAVCLLVAVTRQSGPSVVFR